MPSIFLSYRQSDASAWASLLQRSLEERLPGVNVFQDIDNIPPLVKFADHIARAVGSCDVLIALIGPTWLSSTDEDGNRRLDDVDDFVRMEIATALQRNIPIVPALVDGARMPKRAALPEPLRGLTEWQSHELPFRLWEESCNKLADSLRASLKLPDRGSSHAAQTAVPQDPSQVIPAKHVEPASTTHPTAEPTTGISLASIFRPLLVFALSVVAVAFTNSLGVYMMIALLLAACVGLGFLHRRSSSGLLPYELDIAALWLGVFSAPMFGISYGRAGPVFLLCWVAAATGGGALLRFSGTPTSRQ
jgi:hypothetical protein